MWNLDEIYVPEAIPVQNPYLLPVEAVYYEIQASNTSTSNVNLWQIGVFVWLLGVVSTLAYHGIKHYRFIRMVRRWSDEVTDENLISQFQRIKLKMGIKNQINLETCPCIGTPMMIGLFNPRILLSETYLSKEAEDELSFILHHELVHYKRKDLLYKYLVLLATSLHWFNPIVYLVAKNIKILCEMSCDVEVVKNKDIDIRLSYTKTIISVMRYQSKLQTALSTNFNGGKKGMKKRISSIMDTNKKRAGIAISGLFVALTLGTGIFLSATPPTPEITRTLNIELMEGRIEPSATAIDVGEAAIIGVDALLHYFNIDVTEDDRIEMSYSPAFPNLGPNIMVGVIDDERGRGIHDEYTEILMRAFEESGLTVDEFLANDLVSMFPFLDGTMIWGSPGSPGSVSAWIGAINGEPGTHTPPVAVFMVHGQTGELISITGGTAVTTESRVGLEGEPSQSQFDNAIQYARDAVEALGILQPYNATVCYNFNAWEVIGSPPVYQYGVLVVSEFRPDTLGLIYASNIRVRIEDADGNYVYVGMSGILENELRINYLRFLWSSLEDEIAAIPQLR